MGQGGGLTRLLEGALRGRRQGLYSPGSMGFYVGFIGIKPFGLGDDFQGLG